MKKYYNLSNSSEELQNEIRLLNAQIWKLRYPDTPKALELAVKSFQLANQTGNTALIMQTRLLKTICKFLTSTEVEKIENDLLTLNNYFKDSTDIKSRAITHDYLARLYDSYGFYEKAIEFAKSGIKISKINKIFDVEHEVLTTLANIYRRLRKYEDALCLYKSALKIRENLNDEAAAASSLNLIARTYAENDDINQSFEYYRKALTLREEIKDSAICFTYIGLASNYEIEKKYSLAESMYLKSLESNKRYSNDRMCNYLCLYGLGNIFLKIHDFEKAFIYLNKSLKLAIKTQVKPNISKTHFALSQYHEMTNNHMKAYEHYKTYHKLSVEICNDQIYQLKNIELNRKFQELEQKNNEIIDSIEYSKRIQTAILPSADFVESLLPEQFILYKPKNIVSGDFYWINKFQNKIVIVAADCTGHGVPGALMSMLGVAFLNEIISKTRKLQANLILNKLRNRVKHALKQKGSETEQQDGMDMVLCIIDLNNKSMQFSGAKNPIYLVRRNELTEYKGDKMPIGIYLIEGEFTNNEIQIKKGDMIYMFSDGYIDQFGGEQGRKFLSKKFKDLLMEIHHLNLETQKSILNETIEKWKSNVNSLGEMYEQTDDIMVIGIKI
jgi:serine phosphatase RsbU (regulator of sigma subunit)